MVRLATYGARSGGRQDLRTRLPVAYLVVAVACIPTPYGSVVSAGAGLAIVVCLSARAILWRFSAFRTLFYVAAGWAIGLLFSNISASSGLQTIMFGAWQALVLVAVTGFFLAVRCRGSSHFTRLSLFSFASTGVFSYVMLGEPNFEFVWKYSLAVPTVLAVMLIASREGASQRWLIAAPLGLAVLNASLGFRSLSGVCLGAAILVVLSRRNWGSLRALSVTALVALIASPAVFTLVERAEVGVEAPEPYRLDQYVDFLAGGRPEVVANVAVVSRSPIVGLGSDALLDGATRSAVLEAFRDRHISLTPSDIYRILGNGSVNSHSLLFGAWVTAGVLGALFWMFVVRCVAIGFSRCRTHFMGVGLCWVTWDVFFSPWSIHHEMLLGPILALAIYHSADLDRVAVQG